MPFSMSLSVSWSFAISTQQLALRLVGVWNSLSYCLKLGQPSRENDRLLKCEREKRWKHLGLLRCGTGVQPNRSCLALSLWPLVVLKLMGILPLVRWQKRPFAMWLTYVGTLSE